MPFRARRHSGDACARGAASRGSWLAGNGAQHRPGGARPPEAAEVPDITNQRVVAAGEQRIHRFRSDKRDSRGVWQGNVADALIVDGAAPQRCDGVTWRGADRLQPGPCQSRRELPVPGAVDPAPQALAPEPDQAPTPEIELRRFNRFDDGPPGIARPYQARAGMVGQHFITALLKRVRVRCASFGLGCLGRGAPSRSRGGDELQAVGRRSGQPRAVTPWCIGLRIRPFRNTRVGDECGTQIRFLPDGAQRDACSVISSPAGLRRTQCIRALYAASVLDVVAQPTDNVPWWLSTGPAAQLDLRFNRP